MNSAFSSFSSLLNMWLDDVLRKECCSTFTEEKN